jgi:hypothetical protein
MTKPALTIVVPALFLLGTCSANANEGRDDDVVRNFIASHCLDCHNEASEEAGLSLETLDTSQIAPATDVWESVLDRLVRRQMPPAEMPRPEEEEYGAVIGKLETQLDHAAEVNPRPGRTDTFRRLTRTEYGNAIRDLLALEIDVTKRLPADESSHGFDNVTVSNLSPTLLNRYITAAQKVSQLAVGGQTRSPVGHTVRVRPDITQENHVDGLPIGTRGGVRIEYTFPRDGVYEIQVRLMRDRNEHVEGLNKEHDLEILLDRKRVELFTLLRPRSNTEHATADAHLNVRLPVTAGPHHVGVTFLKQTSALLESKRQPYDAHFNFYRHPRLSPAIYEVSITGPHGSDGPPESAGPSQTPSREQIFVTMPTSAEDEAASARQILRRLLRRAYRRSVTEEDLAEPLEFFHAARADGDFEDGIQAALRAILVNPHFLLRIERDPPGMPPQTAYPVSPFELASRLSFFLWSSLPDETLLDLAERDALNRPEVLEKQVRRMLRDTRSQSLVTNFASQWLYLRNLDSMTPDLRTFPDFDDNLRQAFRRETEQFFESILREDRSVLDLIDADYTFLNERLAKHYDIPHIYGSRMRRVPLPEDARRGGLLRHGSILMVTSYATRTSPVIRGKWILENLLGSPPPPPPENVPPLEDNTVAADLPVRVRLAAHRDNAACASCHNLIDPVGLTLENFDAVGRWRELEFGVPVDASGGLPDGSEWVGVDGLEQGLLNRPEIFVGTMVEKLLTFALGRGIEPSDAPAVRKILRDAKKDDYRFSALIVGIVNSEPFRMRMTE